jgi:hypothetical protein
MFCESVTASNSQTMFGNAESAAATNSQTVFGNSKFSHLYIRPGNTPFDYFGD